ncbi:23S rRNA-intervening sequence protein [Variovorax sp. YR634]|uniref:four helix bundle protein n=1 Tax=Variovorax sp. YR634 TaxID=1884385 RepID=UPI00089A399B|nr:four helix bundle protein [Variovorax sp. YR634]SDX14991.1 23S rRNA-intervening sequence protein [Variovorax sp. YR634]
MALHTELPIYKKGCELVSLAFHVQKEMPRGFKNSLGEKITGHCTEMVNLMALANATRGHDRAAHIRDLLQRQHAATVLLRVCHDSRFISTKLWSQSVQLLDNIGKQGGGWLKVSNVTAPAA